MSWLKVPEKVIRGTWTYAISDISPFHRDTDLLRFIDDTVREQGIRTFCETGFFRGDSTRYMASHYSHLDCHSIELNPEYVLLGRVRLRKYRNVHIHRGDSGEDLARLLPSLRQPILFWLDAHWWGSLPLVPELEAIKKLKPAGVVMVDDVNETDLTYPEYCGKSISRKMLLASGLPFRFMGTVGICSL